MKYLIDTNWNEDDHEYKIRVTELTEGELCQRSIGLTVDVIEPPAVPDLRALYEAIVPVFDPTDADHRTGDRLLRGEEGLLHRLASYLGIGQK